MAGLVYGMFLVALGVVFVIVACNDWYGVHEDPYAQGGSLTLGALFLTAGIMLVRYGMRTSYELDRERKRRRDRERDDGQ